MSSLQIFEPKKFSKKHRDLLVKLENQLIPPKNTVIYETKRFDFLYEEAEELFKKGKYKQSIQKANEYFDKTFVHGCKGLNLLRRCYKKTGENDLLKAYKKAEEFCPLMRIKIDAETFSRSYKALKKYIDMYPDELVFVSFDIFYRGMILGEEIIFDSKWNSSLTYGFLKAIISTKKTTSNNYSYSDYEKLLQKDFTSKPALLVSLGTKYHNFDAVIEGLKYEDIGRARGDFDSIYHNAYDYLGRNQKLSYNDRLYYYLQALKYDSGRLSEYEPGLIGAFFYLDLFQSQDNLELLKVLFSGKVLDFFLMLSNITGKLTDVQKIRKILGWRQETEKFYEIDEKDLIQYLYSVVSRKKLSSTCSYLKKGELHEIFSRHIKEVKKYYHEEEKVFQERERFKKQQEEIKGEIEKEFQRQEEKKSKKGDKKAHPVLLYCFSIGMSFIFIGFVIFIFLKK